MVYNTDNILDINYKESTNKTFTIFWLGFIIYTVSFIAAITNLFSFIVCQGLQVLGLILIVFAASKLIQWKFDNKYLQVIYVIYLIWQGGIILRGFIFEYTFLKEMLFNPYTGVFLYFVPLVLLFPKNAFYLKRLFHTIVIMGVFFIIFDIVLIKFLLYSVYNNNTGQTTLLEVLVKTLSIPCGFILLTLNYHTSKRNIIALFVIFLTLLFAIMRARRGLIFMSFNVLTFSYLLYNFSKKTNLGTKFLSMLLVSFIFIYGVTLFSDNRLSSFDFLARRIDEDTRSGVEAYFYRDMKTQDWIIGKGINGQYYCPGVDGKRLYRSGIETDYLTIILKGGIISLGLLILLTIPAVFKGLFHSKNMLSKAAATWIFLYLIELYPTTVTTFTLNYIIVWISIGICYSSDIRNKTDEEIKDILRYNKHG